jgi:hypothetical protein
MKDRTYKFKKSGNLYMVLEDKAEMKDPGTRKWVECIIYQSLTEPLKIYVREKSDFKKKFELWEEK